MKKTGPSTNRETLHVLGKYLDDALTLANISQSELARRTGSQSSSHLSRVLNGKRNVDRGTLLKWCTELDCPMWLEELILNAAGYASVRQQQAVAEQNVLDDAHKRILEIIAKRE